MNPDKSAPIIDDRNWHQLTVGERIRQLEVEGYVVLPDLLDADHIARLKAQTATFETTPVDYSVHQRGRNNLEFVGGAVSDLIAFPPTLDFLRTLCGNELVLMSYDYSSSGPGHPGISFHCDGQPWGSTIFGTQFSCPKLLRVLYYLDDLTPEVSPFRVIPRSHLSYHNQANPYLRYDAHPEEVMITCGAGSAVVFDHCLFHGNYPNTGDYAREALQLAYRPTWAGPSEAVEPWDAEEVAKLPTAVQEFMGDRGGRIWIPEAGNKPPDMPTAAPGLNPSRWDLE